MAEVSISYKLDLIVVLLDTTTGRVIEERQVLFHCGNQLLSLHASQAGMYILTNKGRNDKKILVEAKGYEPIEVSVCYDGLDAQYPLIEVPLIPVIRPYGYTNLCELSGEKKGLTDISAISINDKLARVCAYSARKNSLRLFSSSRLDEGAYAVFHEENMEFEEFRIIKKAEKDLLLYLDEPMQSECFPEEGIARIVRGSVDAKGRYLLRVVKDGKGTKYLIRYIINGKAAYELHSFGDEEGGTQ